jgi:hypothetical protein
MNDSEKQIAFGGSVKALPNNRVGGYLVRFTDQDDVDLYGEYFDKSTDFLLDEFPVQNFALMLYDHGLDKTIKALGIGRVDTLRMDEEGVYVEAELKALNPKKWKQQQLENSDEYLSIIREMIDEGRIGWSSGAYPTTVEVEQRHIKSWGIVEASLTPRPAGGLHNTRVDMKTYQSLLREGIDPIEATRSIDYLENLQAEVKEMPITKDQFSVMLTKWADDLTKAVCMEMEDEEETRSFANESTEDIKSVVIAEIESRLQPVLDAIADADDAQARIQKAYENAESGILTNPTLLQPTS